ncbi:hypothetical protein PV325_000868 [Microctonus aethiopoides]|nr:hypothetical protein PV325_000868 [Microctonus aethiopoides]
MVKQVAFIFVAIIAFAMGQNQNSQLQSIIAEQVSGLINRTASNSTTSSNSQASNPSCGKDISCYISNALIQFLVNPLIYGLRGILLPILILVRVLLLIVQFLLNIVLGLVTGILQSTLSTMGLGDQGTQVIALLKNVQSLLNQLLPMISTSLNKLQTIPLMNTSSSQK